MSCNQILVKIASNIDSHIIIFLSSSTKKSYSLSVNSVLSASVAIDKRFSKFTCNSWFLSQVLTSLIFEKNLSTYAVLSGKINITWSSFKRLGKVIAQALSFKHVEYNLRVSKVVSGARKVSLFFLVLAIISFISRLYVFQSYASKTLFTLQLQLHHQYLVYINGFTCACFF